MRGFAVPRGLSMLFFALLIVTPMGVVAERPTSPSPIEFVQTLFDGMVRLYTTRGQPAAKIPVGHGEREIKYYRLGGTFALYEFPYNYPQPGTLASLISDSWHQGTLFAFLAEKVSFEPPAEGDMWVFYLPNSPFLADRIGVRKFVFEGGRLQYVWRIEEEELDQVEQLFARWLEKDSFRLLRDNAIVTQTSPYSFMRQPVLSVRYAAFYDAKNQVVPVLVVYVIEDVISQTTRTWFFTFHTPPEDQREALQSPSIPVTVLYNKYGRGQSLLLECFGEVQECIDKILSPGAGQHEVSLEDLLRQLNIAIRVK